MEIREVTYLAVALRIVTAMLVGGLIGLERGLKNRAAGLRTYMLVCVGACLIMLTNQYIFQVYGAGDPVRMGAQVVSGIGFLGAGTIIVTRKSQIKGLTTAAGLWAAAGVGLAIGIGFYEAGILGGASIFIIITLMQRMDNKMHSKGKLMDVYFELDSAANLGSFIRAAQELGIQVDSLQPESLYDREQKVRAYFATLRTADRRYHAQVLEDVGKIEGVMFLQSL